jgi:tetratricopeptide (TPR) repeat protein
MDKSYSSVIVKFEKALEKDPRSRMFAALAEAYRKIGLHDKALPLIKKGIRFNPEYVMGYYELAAFHLDKGEYQLAYSTLRPILTQNRDNLKLQRLFAESCLKLDLYEEALDTYKYLLFINPKNEEVSQAVAYLEEKVNETILEPFQPEEKIVFDIDGLESNPMAEQGKIDDWVQVDLTNEEEEESEVEGWQLNPEEVYEEALEDHPENKKEEIETRQADSRETPIITHTLVDIYLSQGHIDKAREVLEKILQLSPDDKKTMEKLRELNESSEEEDASVESEDEGRLELMKSFDENVESIGEDEVEIVKERLLAFRDAVSKRAQEKKL